MKVLNFGSLNIDNVYQVENFVRAGETISSLKLENHCGGKGLNQSIALARAGAEVWHAGCIGADGDILRNRLSQENINLTFLETVQDEKSGHAIIQVDQNGQNCIVLYKGSNYCFTEADVDRILASFDEGDVLLLQNETSCVEYAIEAAHNKGMLVALNPSPITQELAQSHTMQFVDWFILNEIEGKEISGKADPTEICKELVARNPKCKVMLTLGSDGCVYYDGETTASHGIYKVDVVDTTAAGDTFAGYFLACVAEGLSIERILELASKASGIAVSRAGASDSIPTRDEVEKAEMQLR